MTPCPSPRGRLRWVTVFVVSKTGKAVLRYWPVQSQTKEWCKSSRRGSTGIVLALPRSAASHRRGAVSLAGGRRTAAFHRTRQARRPRPRRRTTGSPSTSSHRQQQAVCRTDTGQPHSRAGAGRRRCSHERGEDRDRRRGPGGPRRQPLSDGGRPRPRTARAGPRGRAVALGALGFADAALPEPAQWAARSVAPRRPGCVPEPSGIRRLPRPLRASFAAPVREGAAVRSVERRRGWFRVATDAGDWRARNVVVATGWADVPTTPRLAASAPDGVVQLHSREYRSPVGLPPGGVLVVGAGPAARRSRSSCAEPGVPS